MQLMQACDTHASSPCLGCESLPELSQLPIRWLIFIEAGLVTPEKQHVNDEDNVFTCFYTSHRPQPIFHLKGRGFLDEDDGSHQSSAPQQRTSEPPRFSRFKNTYQSGFLSILYSIGSKPLQIWDKKARGPGVQGRAFEGDGKSSGKLT